MSTPAKKAPAKKAPAKKQAAAPAAAKASRVGKVVRHSYVDAMTNQPADDRGVVVEDQGDHLVVAKLADLVTVAAADLEVVS